MCYVSHYSCLRHSPSRFGEKYLPQPVSAPTCQCDARGARPVAREPSKAWLRAPIALSPPFSTTPRGVLPPILPLPRRGLAVSASKRSLDASTTNQERPVHSSSTSAVGWGLSSRRPTQTASGIFHSTFFTLNGKGIFYLLNTQCPFVRLT